MTKDMMESAELREIMTAEPRWLGPEASIREVAALMDDEDVGVVPVCESGALIGIVTDRDLVVRSLSIGQDPVSTRVREAMTQPVIPIFVDQSIEDAARLMGEMQIRRLPVVDRSMRLVGIVSLGDLATATHDRRLSAEVLERVSARMTSPTRRAA